MSRGRGLVSAALIGLALVMFVPAFAQAGAGFSAPGWQYADQLGLVLEYLPLLLAVVALAVWAKPVAEGLR